MEADELWPLGTHVITLLFVLGVSCSFIKLWLLNEEKEISGFLHTASVCPLDNGSYALEFHRRDSGRLPRAGAGETVSPTAPTVEVWATLGRTPRGLLCLLCSSSGS